MHAKSICLWFILFVAVCGSALAVTYVVPADDVLVQKAGAVVIARALTSYVEESDRSGIETVTVLRIEDVLKGDVLAQAEIKVRTIGGVLGKRAKLVPGAPRFTDGERVLVFISRLPNGDYGVTDFGLGLFAFDTDESGRSVVIRQASEIHGWNPDGTVHHESRRDATQFISFIRGAANHLPVRNNYTVEPLRLISEPQVKAYRKLRPVVMAFSGKQYSIPSGDESSDGFRWTAFPSAVNWNKGNNETGGVADGGTASINAAFASWNGDSGSNTNYVFATTTANTNGIDEAPDGVNNIVFDKVITGVNAFTCNAQGFSGTLGVGGIQVGSGTNVLNGETFFTTLEADVSMIKGVGPCVGVRGVITIGDYNSAVTHEFGHTLGLRHADKNRSDGATCASAGTYDCASSAIMTAFITNGLNAALQPWDQSAIRALYPTPATSFNPPTNVNAFAPTTTSVSISWTAPAAGTLPIPRYNVYRSSSTNFASFSQVGNTTLTNFTDNTAVANSSYLYKVRSAAADGTGESADSGRDIATTVTFTDSLSNGFAPMKALHINQIRAAVNAVQALAGSAPTAFGTATAGSSVVLRTDIVNLRSAVDSARTTMGLSPMVYSESITAGVTTVKATHFNELRSATSAP